MSGMTDPAGNAWSWGFDVLGHQVSATDPDSGTTTSTVDDAGNVLTSTDGRGITVAYRYDNLNRKTGQYVGSNTGAQLAAWTYDTVAKGQPVSSTRYVGSVPGALGSAYTSTVHNPTTASGATITDSYAYPAAGTAHPHAVNTLTHTGAGSPPADTYTYDAAGNTTGRPGQTLTLNRPKFSAAPMRDCTLNGVTPIEEIRDDCFG